MVRLGLHHMCLAVCGIAIGLYLLGSAEFCLTELSAVELGLCFTVHVPVCALFNCYGAYRRARVMM